jgi:nitrous oxidase accessory protein NosD
MGLCLMAMGLVVQEAWAGTCCFVAPGGSDAGNNCEDQWARCATIQHAIDEASAGDWVNVAPGTYAEDLTIDKPLTLRSERPVPEYWYEPETRIDGGTGTAIKVEANAVQISRFEVSTDGTAPTILASGASVNDLQVEENVISGGSAGVYLEAGGKKDMIGFNVIEGTGDGIHLGGAEYSNLMIRANRFAAPIDEYAVLADSGGTIEGFRLEGNKMAAPSRVAARVSEAPDEESELYGNTFESTVGPQLAVDAAQLRVFDNRFEGHGSAGCLQILGNEGGLAPSKHILVSLHNEFVDCDPYGIELGPEVDDIKIYGSEFPGSYDGIVASGASPWNLTGHVLIQTNRIVGTTHLGVDNEASGTLDAEQNWWGCDAGPGAAGCDGVSDGVNAANNAVLTGLISPRKPETGIEELPTGNSITLNPGEKAEVAAMLLANGLGINNGIPTEKTPIGFSSTLGTLSPTSSTLSNGWTKSFFTAGATPGHGSIVLSLDNARTLVPVTITGEKTESPAPPPPETPPAPRLAVRGKHALLSGRQASVGLVSCTASCRVAPSKAAIVVGSHHYRGTITPQGQLGAETTTAIRVTLPAAAMRALKKHGSARIRVTLTVTDSNSRTAKRAISVTLSA